MARSSLAAVLTFSTIHGGSASNQTPDEVVLTGTMRSQSDVARETLRNSLVRMAKAVAEIHRMEVEVDLLDGVGVTKNDPEVLSVLVAASGTAVGPEKVVNLGPGSMGSEDFAEFTALVPSAHIRVGSKRSDRETMLHRSNFDLDEACIATAVRCLSRAAIQLMHQGTLTASTPEGPEYPRDRSAGPQGAREAVARARRSESGEGRSPEYRPRPNPPVAPAGAVGSGAACDAPAPEGHGERARRHVPLTPRVARWSGHERRLVRPTLEQREPGLPAVGSAVRQAVLPARIRAFRTSHMPGEKAEGWLVRDPRPPHARPQVGPDCRQRWGKLP